MGRETKRLKTEWIANTLKIILHKPLSQRRHRDHVGQDHQFELQRVTQRYEEVLFSFLCHPQICHRPVEFKKTWSIASNKFNGNNRYNKSAIRQNQLTWFKYRNKGKPKFSCFGHWGRESNTTNIRIIMMDMCAQRERYCTLHRWNASKWWRLKIFNNNQSFESYS